MLFQDAIENRKTCILSFYLGLACNPMGSPSEDKRKVRRGGV